MSKLNPLIDVDFLKRLDTEKEREVFAKVIALDWDENPMEEITGRVTSGSVNIDGSSAVRRTCSVALVAEELNIHDYYWGMNTKFKLSVGLKNHIEPKYDDIIWFPMGTYVIASFNTSQSTNNYNVNIQGKDKMTLLNGELGGVVNSLTWDFGSMDEIAADGTITNKKILLKDIIIEAVHEFAREPYHNIIVNDLDTFGVELMEYRGNDDMYLIVDQETLEVSNMTTDGKTSYDYYRREKSNTWAYGPIRIGEFYTNEDEGITYDGIKDNPYDTGTDRLSVETNMLYVASSNNPKKYYSVMRATYGMTVGYRVTDLTYAGDLIAQVGNPITTAVLDKIKSMLGEFEYFYDIDGRFIFQKKKTYISTAYNGAQENDDGEKWFNNVAETSAITYYFEDAQIITSFSNQPNLANLRNDFSIWGTRKSVSGNEIPVHMRYAIDRKPVFYKNYDGITYISDMEVLEKEKETIKQSILKDLTDRVVSYEPTYGCALTELESPQKNADGSWTPGWWDIRDWYEYYFALKQEYPNGTMKWYSQNDSSGCIPISDIPSQAERSGYCWLIIYDPETGYYNFQHGSGDPATGGKRTCTYYISSLTADGKVHTRPATPTVKKDFIAPYSGCSDNHTFLEFLKSDIEKGGQLVYFYNPAFPNTSSFEQVIEEQVQKEFDEAINSGAIQPVGDWREIIYQMAKDNMSNGHKDNFQARVAQNNENYYPTGQTGYEQYYTDMLSFWRQIYNPTYLNNFELTHIAKSTFDKNPSKYWKAVRCKAEDEYSEGYWLKKTGVDASTYDVVSMTQKIWDTKLTGAEHTYYYKLVQGKTGDVFQSSADYFVEVTDDFITDENSGVQGWAKEVADYPEMLNFWFDFLDARDGDLDKYNVQNVGIRPKAENDTNVKAIYFRDTPNVIFVDITKIKKGEKQRLIDHYGSEQEWLLSIEANLTEDEKTANADNLQAYIADKQTYELQCAVENNVQAQKEEMTGYTFIKLPTYMENLFSISAQGKSAFDKLDNWLYSYACCTESISISALPVYYLAPNTRIFVKDANSNIEGEYIISRISLPLSYNGMMSISATKAVSRLY